MLQIDKRHVAALEMENVLRLTGDTPQEMQTCLLSCTKRRDSHFPQMEAMCFPESVLVTYEEASQGSSYVQLL